MLTENDSVDSGPENTKYRREGCKRGGWRGGQGARLVPNSQGGGKH